MIRMKIEQIAVIKYLILLLALFCTITTFAAVILLLLEFSVGSDDCLWVITRWYWEPSKLNYIVYNSQELPIWDLRMRVKQTILKFKGWLANYKPPPVFRSNILLEHSHAYSVRYCLRLVSCYSWGIEELPHRPFTKKSRMLLSGPLQKRFANFWSHWYSLGFWADVSLTQTEVFRDLEHDFF